MSNINTRTPFFPSTANQKNKIQQAKALMRNSEVRAQEIQNKTKDDVSIKIPQAVKDFSRIKKVATQAEIPSREDRIAELKEQIQSGTYKVDYDQLSKKMLESEMI